MPFKDPDKKKSHNKTYSAKHYEINAAAIKARTAKRRREDKAKFMAYKATLSCEHCGENHPAALDFHHVNPDPSNHKINELVKNRSYKLAYKEIEDKCIVLCSNCHRKHHHEERVAQNQSQVDVLVQNLRDSESIDNHLAEYELNKSTGEVQKK